MLAHRSSLLQRRRATVPQRNRHAGKLAVACATVWRRCGHVGDEEQFTALHETRFRCRLRREEPAGRRVGRGSDYGYRDGVDMLDEWVISLAEELGEDPSAQKTFEDTLCHHFGFRCLSHRKPMFRTMRDKSVTVAGATELKAWLCHSFL